MVTILSIDGGGIRGIIPAAFLAELEKRTGKPISRLFDLVAGTSTGGILAATLTVPDGEGKPKYTAEFIHSAYFEMGRDIFHRGPLRSAVTLGGLARPKYSPRALTSILNQYLGDVRLHTTLTEVLITAYDMASSTPWFFKTSYAKLHQTPENDPLLAQVVRATTAAPTYFPPLSMEGHCMVDGGIFACNPALCAYAQARNMFPEEKQFLVVSLGTGTHQHDYPPSRIDNWGIAGWAVPISDIMLNSSSATVDYQMRALVGSPNYARFQVQLEESGTAMDDASPANMRYLEDVAQKEIQRQSAAIDRLCRSLSRNEHQR